MSGRARRQPHRHDLRDGQRDARGPCVAHGGAEAFSRAGPFRRATATARAGASPFGATKLARVTGRIDVSGRHPLRSFPRKREPRLGREWLEELDPRFRGDERSGRWNRDRHGQPRCTLGKHAVIDASGTGNGGTVLIGGDRQGGANKGARFRQARDRQCANDDCRSGRANPRRRRGRGRRGHGRQCRGVVGQAHGVCRRDGVTGGAQGGDGGFVETSSHGVLDFTGTANRLAPKGKAGTLLLDPTDLDIVAGAAGASTGTSTTGGTISATGTPNPSMLTVGTPAALRGGNVIVQTSGTLGPETGSAISMCRRAYLVEREFAGGSALSYTDKGGSYALGNITADAFTLNETATSATISQAANTNLQGHSYSQSSPVERGADFVLTAANGNSVGAHEGHARRRRRRSELHAGNDRRGTV